MIRKYQYTNTELTRTGITENPATSLSPANNRNMYTPITFNGMPANKRVQQTGGPTGFYPETEIIFNAKGLAWDITYPNTDGDGKHDQIYDQILSTFRFDSLTTSKFTDQITSTGMELVKIEQGGGLCPNGPCSSSSAILKDGSVIRDGKKVKTINSDEIVQIQTLINNANFAQIKSKPFTGTCPTAYDGQEITYVFYTNSGAETISSCKVKIDVNDPLFKKTYGLLK